MIEMKVMNGVEYAYVRTTHELISYSAKKYGDKPAVKYIVADEQIAVKSFIDLKRDVNIVSSYLVATSTQATPPRHVAIFGTISYEWLVAYYGILGASFVVVPIDGALPVKEIRDLLIQADIAIVVYGDVFATKIAELQTQDLSIEQYISLESGNESTSVVDIILRNDTLGVIFAPKPESLATIVYTSGTTGKSKGVMLTHRNICDNLVYSHLIVRDSPQRKATIPILPMHHMFEITAGIQGPIFGGYPICIGKGTKYVFQSLQLFNPSILMLVPSVVAMFHKRIWMEAKQKGTSDELRNRLELCQQQMADGIDNRKEIFADIRKLFGGDLTTVVCGGAPLDAQLVHEFNCFGIALLNGYGITECSPVISCNRFTQIKLGSVGLIDNEYVQVRIEDGEILVAGNNIMRGYYKNQEATAEALSGGYFRTGDLGYLDEDGFLFITGRKKNLIILDNGENVSPEELEDFFSKPKLVAEILVYEKKVKNRQQLAARIVPNTEYAEQNGIDDVLSVLKAEFDQINNTLPTYKQIQSVELQDEGFQKTALGKIKRYLQ